MWTITGNDGHQFHKAEGLVEQHGRRLLLPTGNEYVIGRGNDICFSSKVVSRSFGTLRVVLGDFNPDAPQAACHRLVFKNTSAKSETYAVLRPNREDPSEAPAKIEISVGQEQDMIDGDEILGSKGARLTVKWTPIVIAVEEKSNPENKDLKLLCARADELGFPTVEFSAVSAFATHVIMLDTKVFRDPTSLLPHLTRFVRVTWLSDLLSACARGEAGRPSQLELHIDSEWPNESKYVSNISDRELPPDPTYQDFYTDENLWKPIEARKTLFKGLTFLICGGIDPVKTSTKKFMTSAQRLLSNCAAAKIVCHDVYVEGSKTPFTRSYLRDLKSPADATYAKACINTGVALPAAAKSSGLVLVMLTQAKIHLEKRGELEDYIKASESISQCWATMADLQGAVMACDVDVLFAKARQEGESQTQASMRSQIKGTYDSSTLAETRRSNAVAGPSKNNFGSSSRDALPPLQEQPSAAILYAQASVAKPAPIKAHNDGDEDRRIVKRVMRRNNTARSFEPPPMPEPSENGLAPPPIARTSSLARSIDAMSMDDEPSAQASTRASDGEPRTMKRVISRGRTQPLYDGGPSYEQPSKTEQLAKRLTAQKKGALDSQSQRQSEKIINRVVEGVEESDDDDAIIVDSNECQVDPNAGAAKSEDYIGRLVNKSKTQEEEEERKRIKEVDEQIKRRASQPKAIPQHPKAPSAPPLQEEELEAGFFNSPVKQPRRKTSGFPNSQQQETEKGATMQGVTKDENFLTAVKKGKRAKEDELALDNEFNKLRIAKPNYKNGALGSNHVVDKKNLGDVDYGIMDDFLDEPTPGGNYIEIHFVNMIVKNKRLGNVGGELPAIAVDGVPNFKKFKKKGAAGKDAVKRRVPIKLGTFTTDFGTGDRFWEDKEGEPATQPRQSQTQQKMASITQTQPSRVASTASSNKRKRNLVPIESSEDEDQAVPSKPAAKKAKGAGAASKLTKKDVIEISDDNEDDDDVHNTRRSGRGTSASTTTMRDDTPSGTSSSNKALSGALKRKKELVANDDSDDDQRGTAFRKFKSNARR